MGLVQRLHKDSGFAVQGSGSQELDEIPSGLSLYIRVDESVQAVPGEGPGGDERQDKRLEKQKT